MSDDYLWDRSGPPDPEIERLERALAPLRFSGAPLLLPARRSGPARRWVIAAGVMLASAAAVALWLGRPTPGEGRAVVARPLDTRPAQREELGWQVIATAGRPLLEAGIVSEQTHLAPGQTLITNATSEARMAVPETGTVDVRPNSRVRLVSARAGGHRLELERGSIYVFIGAPPGTFFVVTPAGVLVDLGCSYTVTVDAAGEGSIEVHSGWVGFAEQGRESLIPAGASCAIRRGRGPGTPHFATASLAFREALAALDTPPDAAGSDERRQALRTVLASARPEDAVTLWHLLPRASPGERQQLLGRLHALVPALRQVDRRQVLAGERQALDQLWDHLGVGPIAHWRRWSADLR